MKPLTKAQMLRGDDFVVNERLTIKNHTLGEMIDFGEEKYFSAVNVFLARSFDYMVQLDDSGIDYEKISDFQMCIFLYQDKIVQEYLKFLYGDLNFEIATKKDTNDVILLDPKNNIIIDEVIYTYISNYLKTVNCIELKKKIKPANDWVKKELINQERNRIKRALEKKLKQNQFIEDDNLSKLISALSWGNSVGINIKNVWDLNLYQFYDGLKTLDKQKHVQILLTGIYSGAIDSKKIDSELLNWMR
jgi:hypothetical protein